MIVRVLQDSVAGLLFSNMYSNISKYMIGFFSLISRNRVGDKKTYAQ